VHALNCVQWAQAGIDCPVLLLLLLLLVLQTLLLKTNNSPSTVTTCMPSTAYSGHRQAFTALCCTLSPSQCDTITVQAPQPPSPQPSLVPVSPFSTNNSADK
jgi:hypothetical protein